MSGPLPGECRGIFVGGSVRSGTHALAALIGTHSSIAAIPRELRFHAEIAARTPGLPSFLAGKVTPAQVSAYMRGEVWFRRPAFDESISRGLHKTIRRGVLEAALEAFDRLADTDRVKAARALLHGIADPIAREQGRDRWVEMTPWNAAAAPALLKALPDLRLIHVVRDGRDVACSVARLPWGPGSVEEGLRLWANRVRLAERGLREVPASQVLTIHLEQLALTNRDVTYRRLLGFLGIEDQPGMSALFADEITARKAHLGRWRQELAPGRRKELSDTYARLLDDLASEGLRFLPPLAPLPAGFEGFGPDAGRSRLDPWADGRAAGA